MGKRRVFIFLLLILVVIESPIQVFSRAVSAPRLSPPEFKDSRSISTFFNIPNNLYKPQSWEKPRDQAVDDKLEISLPAIRPPVERKVMRILYGPILGNVSSKEVEYDSQLGDTPSATTFRPSTSPAILIKKPTPSTESSIIDDDDHLLVSSSSVLQTLPKLQTVVPYDLWPYSGSVKPVQVNPIRFSSYFSGEDLNYDRDSKEDVPTSSAVDSASDSSAVNLKYYNLDPVQPSSYTRSTYELTDHFTEPTRSHSTSVESSSSPAGLSYSYFVFGSSSKPEEDSSRHKSNSGIITTQTSSSSLPDPNFDYAGITIPTSKENFQIDTSLKTSSPRQKNLLFQSLINEDRYKDPKTSRDEKEKHSEEQGTSLEMFPEKDSFFHFESTNGNASRANGGYVDDTIGPSIKSSSFYLSSPGPPYRDETQLSTFQQDIINPTNNGGFIPSPPASSSNSNLKEIASYPPPRSIYDEIQKSTSLAKSHGKPKQTNKENDTNLTKYVRYLKPSALGDFGSSFQGLVLESPPKLKEEVLSFIKTYSENPFDLSLAGNVDSNFEPVTKYGSKVPHTAGNKNGSENNEIAYYQKVPQVNSTPSPLKDTTKSSPNSYTTYGDFLSSHQNPYRNASSVGPSSKPKNIKNSVYPSQANHLSAAVPQLSRKPDLPVLTPAQATKNPIISYATTTQTLSSTKIVSIPPATSRPQNAPSTTVKYESVLVAPKPSQATTVTSTIPNKASATPYNYPAVNLLKTQQLTSNKLIQSTSKSIHNHTPDPVKIAAFQPAFKPLSHIVPISPQTLRFNSNISVPSRPIQQTAHVTSNLEHRPRPAPVPVAAPIPVYISNGPKPKVYSPLSLSLARPIRVIFAYG